MPGPLHGSAATQIRHNKVRKWKPRVESGGVVWWWRLDSHQARNAKYSAEVLVTIFDGKPRVTKLRREFGPPRNKKGLN